MNTAVINIKTDPKVKTDAQKIARQIGVSLSSLINAYLKRFIRTKTVTFSADDEVPNKHTLAIMRQAEKDYKRGNTSPAFKTGEEAVAWLEKQGI